MTAPTNTNPAPRKGHLAVVLPDGTAAYRRTERAYTHVLAGVKDGTSVALSWHSSLALAQKAGLTPTWQARYSPLEVCPVWDPTTAPVAEEAPTPRKSRKVRHLAAVEDPTPGLTGPEGLPLAPVAEEPAKRKSLPNAERRSEATHADGGSAVSHGKCPQCAARKGVVCTSSRGFPTNAVHAPRMRAWEAAGSPSLELPAPARKRGGVWVVAE